MNSQAARRNPSLMSHGFPVIETVSGFGNPQNLMAYSGNNGTILSGQYSNATVGFSLGGTYVVSSSDYDPDFVKSILDADRAPPEARFNNVVDMLDWLNH